MARQIQFKRKTSETDIRLALGVYGKGRYAIDTGIKFLDHMLSLFAKHGLFDLNLKAKGDLDVDIHHTNEDVGLALGEAFSMGLGKRAGIRRFGDATVPMDESLVRVVVDISGRPFLKFRSRDIKVKSFKGYSLNYAEQFLRAFITQAGMTVHVDILEGDDLHHILEGVFKAFAKALSKAVEKNPRAEGVPSTKGRI